MNEKELKELCYLVFSYCYHFFHKLKNASFYNLHTSDMHGVMCIFSRKDVTIVHVIPYTHIMYIYGLVKKVLIRIFFLFLAV